MPDCEQIDPTRDRVWAVDVTVAYTSYVITQTAADAERMARDAADGLEPEFTARELTEPLQPEGRGRLVPLGRTSWEGRELTVNQAVELVAAHKPAFDDETALMPFAEGPPPLYPPRIEDYLADGREAR